MPLERPSGGTKRGVALRLLAAFVVAGTVLPLIREPHWWTPDAEAEDHEQAEEIIDEARD